MLVTGLGCTARSHVGAVVGGTPKVEYQCTATEGKLLRWTGMTYPDGSSQIFEFGAVVSIDDAPNPVQSVHEDLTALAEYQFVGLAMPAD